MGTYTRRCFNDACDHYLESTTLDYERCPKCGAATVPTLVISHIEKEAANAPNRRVEDHIVYGGYARYFACRHAYDCYLLGNYRPECEEKVLRVECLTILKTNQEAILDRVDRILEILDQTDPPHQP